MVAYTSVFVFSHILVFLGTSQLLLLMFYTLPQLLRVVNPPRLDPLTDAQLQQVAALSDFTLLNASNGAYLSPLLIPRVSDTASNLAIREFLQTTLENLGWSVSLDGPFHNSTPLGEKTFTNLIASKRSAAGKRVIFAAHFDSKYFPPPQQFIGAIDSAVSCAILLDLARTIGPLWESGPRTIGMDLVFFDGEEAFVKWSEQDSTYGSRHLAERWEKERQIANISLFVLLDLLGAGGGTIPIIQKETISQFNQLRTIHDSLKRLDLLPTTSSNGTPRNGTSSNGTPSNGTSSNGTLGNGGQTKLATEFIDGYAVEDDHLPFLQRGVPILHLIPVPFPQVWHTLADNATAIDEQNVQELAVLFRAFAAELLGVFQLERGQEELETLAVNRTLPNEHGWW